LKEVREAAQVMLEKTELRECHTMKFAKKGTSTPNVEPPLLLEDASISAGGNYAAHSLVPYTMHSPGNGELSSARPPHREAELPPRPPTPIAKDARTPAEKELCREVAHKLAALQAAYQGDSLKDTLFYTVTLVDAMIIKDVAEQLKWRVAFAVQPDDEVFLWIGKDAVTLNRLAKLPSPPSTSAKSGADEQKPQSPQPNTSTEPSASTAANPSTTGVPQAKSEPTHPGGTQTKSAGKATARTTFSQTSSSASQSFVYNPNAWNDAVSGSASATTADMNNKSWFAFSQNTSTHTSATSVPSQAKGNSPFVFSGSTSSSASTFSFSGGIVGSDISNGDSNQGVGVQNTKPFKFGP
jgi:hypothetical protein